MSKFKRIILVVTIVASLLLGIGAWQLYQVINYNVTEEELGVEENFFDLSSNIQLPIEDSTIESSEVLNNEEIAEKIEVEEAKEVSGNVVTEENKDKNKVVPNEVKKEEKKQVVQKDNLKKQVDNEVISEARKVEPVKIKTKQEQINLVKNKYYPVFKQLQTEAVNRLDILYAKAKKEYLQKRENPDFAKKEFAAKYISASKKLEDAVNKVFYQTLDSMKKELKNKDLPLDIANEAEQTYKQMIKSKKSEMVDKYL